MSHLSISLLGSPKITLDGVQVKIPTFRAIPLLAYLAITGVSQTRETLASLLWSESSLPHALGSLRTTLWRLKSAGLDEWIILDHNEISLNYHKSIDIDALEFKEKINKYSIHGHPSSQICLLCIQNLTEAVELYQGAFLSGINLSKAQAFDEWRMQESENLYILYLDALEKLVRAHRTFGDFNLAIHYARMWLSHDLYNETAQYDLLQLYSITGQRAIAISQYKRYKNFISRELGIEPSEEITNLYKQILSGLTISSATQKAKSHVFLTSDIEKAASFWSKAGIDKTQILAKYHDIFSETCKRFGGQILQKSEDSITVLFENGQTLHCAVTIHLILKKMDWGEAGIPSIRMVLYSTATDDTYNNSFSMVTRAAANLLSISWGGQIIITEQTLKHLDLPPGSRVKDLGYHSLLDATESVHVYELLHPHLLAIEHRPLQTVNPRSMNFPTYAPLFIGREEELKELSTLIDEPSTRVISLVGPGGVGKTRIAVQFSTQIAGHFSDGAFFISLSSVQDPEFIPIILADALKFSFFGPRNHTEQIANYLNRMKVLLVFDNFDHLRRKGIEFLVFLLNQTQYLKIIVTTRERMNLISETIVEVHGLPTPSSDIVEDGERFSSIQLFLTTARRILRGFSYADNAAAIIRICRLVNGLPLGIILASSWVRVYSCPQIAEEIKKNIDFLATSAPDLAPRHRSLRAVFDNSWVLLSKEERVILSKLSIFQSAFTHHATQEICLASPVLLSAFVDKSLLQRRQDGRYEMLNTFHLYATEKLNEVDDELSVTRTKFCEYYADLCTKKQYELNSPTQRQAIDELTNEIENIRTAWGWMIDLNLWEMIDRVKEPLLAYHVILGNFVHGREFFRLCLTKLNKLNLPSLDLILASMQQREAWLTFRIGFITEGLAELEKSMETFRRYNSKWDLAMSLQFLAEAYRTIGDPRKAKNFILEALRILQQDISLKSNYVLAYSAHCKSILGRILMELGEIEQALINLESSLAAHRQLGTFYGTIHPLMGLGRLAYLEGEYTRSRDLYLKALETATMIYDQHGMAQIHNHLSALYEGMGNPSESYQHMLTAFNLCKETGDRRLTAIILNNLAYHNLKYLHLPSDAIRTYHESIAIFSDLGDLRGLAYSFYDISKAYLQVGLVKDALNFCFQSLQAAMTLDSIPLILHSLHGFAYIYANTGYHERALRLCNQIENHPQIEPDTQKRVIVTRAELETILPPETVDTAQIWAESSNLQDVIDQIIRERQD
jgi:DNA-binding SARP family transcriptional activator/predicted ATPase